MCILAGVAPHAAALSVVRAHQAAVAELPGIAAPCVLSRVSKGACPPVMLHLKDSAPATRGESKEQEARALNREVCGVASVGWC